MHGKFACRYGLCPDAPARCRGPCAPSPIPLSLEPISGLRRLQEDLRRAILDAQDRGVSMPQIEFRLLELAAAMKSR